MLVKSFLPQYPLHSGAGIFLLLLLASLSQGCGSSSHVNEEVAQSETSPDASEQSADSSPQQKAPVFAVEDKKPSEEAAAEAGKPPAGLFEQVESEPTSKLFSDDDTSELDALLDQEQAPSGEVAAGPMPAESKEETGDGDQPKAPEETELSEEMKRLLTEQTPLEEVVPDFTNEPGYQKIEFYSVGQPTDPPDFLKEAEKAEQAERPDKPRDEDWKVVVRASWKAYLPPLGLKFVDGRIEELPSTTRQSDGPQFLIVGSAGFDQEMPFEAQDQKLQEIVKQLKDVGVKLQYLVERVGAGRPLARHILTANCDNLEDEEALKLLANFPEIKRLSLIGNPYVSSKAIGHIIQLKNLEELHLQRSPFGDDAVAELAKLESLQKLNLSLTDITDVSFPTFAQLPKLKTLVLEGTSMSETMVNKLKKKLLKDCDIHYSSIDVPKDYSNIEGLGYVIKSTQGHYATTAIRLGSTRLTDSYLLRLKPFTGLNVVCVDGTRVNGDGFRHLKQHKLITCVIVRNSPFTDEGLEQLAEFRNLNYVVIEGGSMSEEGIRQFQEKCPQVELVLLD